ncbi:MAG: glucose 1-dehydrogenase [Ignavibacteriales bacterium]|nr:glucose 1-dehydrogenase [Ignavibacteriales bacterium]
MINLHGKVAFVTGGSRGIGAACALLLAQAGAHVAITYRLREKEGERIRKQISRLGKRCLLIRAVASSQRSVLEAVRSVHREFGRIDILVNNAGIWKKASLAAMSTRQWDETLSTNLKGVFLFCRAVVPLMKRRGGKIINISSTAGQRGEPFHSHYAASKGGVIAFTKSIAVELAPFGIHVNCVAPGWVDTEMSASALRPRSSRKRIEELIPRGRVATPEEIAGPVLFLASSLSDHLIGATLSVNGGSVMS